MFLAAFLQSKPGTSALENSNLLWTLYEHCTRFVMGLMLVALPVATILIRHETSVQRL